MNCDEQPLAELVRGELEQTEAEAVLAHLRECATCRERVRVMALLDSTQATACTSPRRPHRFRIWTLAAACTAVLVGVTVIRLGEELSGDLRKWATQEAYPLVRLETRSTDPSDCAQAYDYYQSGRFRQAAEQFRHCPQDTASRFYGGVSEYLAGDHEASLRLLGPVAREAGPWQGPALWYAAHSSLARDDRKAAVEWLTRSAATPGPFRDEALRLLQALGEKSP